MKPDARAPDPEERLARKRAAGKRWREENPDKVRAYKREYMRRNPDKVRVWMKRWKKNNPEKVQAQHHRRALRRIDDFSTPRYSVEENRAWLAANYSTFIRTLRRKVYSTFPEQVREDIISDTVLAIAEGRVIAENALQYVRALQNVQFNLQRSEYPLMSHEA